MYVVIDAARGAFDTVDAETLVIDTANGHLFMLAGTLSTIWERFLQPADLDDVERSARGRFGDEAATALRAALDELLQAGLLVEIGEPAGEVAAIDVPWPDEFVLPTIERFDDIADIMSLDPIHDVSSSGWPHARPDTAS
jgi:hypothetical protein